MPVQTKHVVVLLACLGVGVVDLAVINGVLAPRLASETTAEPEAVAVVATSQGPSAPARAETSEPAVGAIVAPAPPATAPGPTAEPEGVPSAQPAAVASAEPETVASAQPESVASAKPATPASPTPSAPEASAAASPAPSFEDITFGTRSAELTEAAETRLHQVAQAMRRDKALRLVVRGHTDERGDDAANERLAAARAEHAARFLSRLGVGRSRIEIEAVGSREPLDNSGTREAWAKNRRVQFVWK